MSHRDRACWLCEQRDENGDRVYRDRPGFLCHQCELHLHAVGGAMWSSATGKAEKICIRCAEADE